MSQSVCVKVASSFVYWGLCIVNHIFLISEVLSILGKPDVHHAERVALTSISVPTQEADHI